MARNIDRLFAIWQALHPDKNKSPDRYVTSQKNERGTFIAGPQKDETIDTPLAPFRMNVDRYWTSAEVKQTSLFGYAYPETQERKFAEKEDYRSAIIDDLWRVSPSPSLAMILARKAQSQQVALTKIKKASTFWQQREQPVGYKGIRSLKYLSS